MRITALGIALTLATASPLGAQEVAGRLEGRVLTPDGVPLAQVELTVTSPSLLGQRTVSTDQRGRFLIPALPVGTYRVQVRRIGFRPLAIEAVPVRLGETTSLPRVTLEPAAVELRELIVTAEAAGFDPRNTAQRIILDATRLDALPLERNFRQIMLLHSSAIPSFLGSGDNRDGINVAGATGFENTYFVDGINITSPIRGETSIDLPYNFIHQIEVRTGGSTAEDAQALGGVVNVVTPSGGNQLRGQVFGFFSNDRLETEARLVNGYYQTGFTFYDAGASLSGPVVRERLWFFAAYNGTYERRDHTYSFGALAETKRQHLFAGKLTWQAGRRTSAVFTILGDPSRLRPLTLPIFGTGVPQNPESIQQRAEAGGVGISLRGQHVLGPGVLLEAAVAQMTRLETGEPATSAGLGPVVIDQLNGTISGGLGLATRYESRRRSARADLSWQVATHSLKGGVQYEELYGDLSYDANRNSAGGTITRSGANLYTWHWFLLKNGRGTNRNPSFYLQDGWQLTPRLLVNAGLRWSRQDLHDAGNSSTYSGFRVHDGLQPRLGIVYQPGTIGTQRLFASYNRAAEQLPVWLFQVFAPGAESLFTYVEDPRFDPSGGELVYTSQLGAGTPADSNLRGQTVEGWSIGYNRRLGRGASVSLVAMRRSLRRVFSGGATLDSWIWGNPGEGAMAQFPRPRRTYDALEATLERTGGPSWFRLSYVLSRTHGNYPGLFQSDWNLGFTNAGPIFASLEQHVNETGLLPNDRTHVLKAFGAHQFSFGLNVGASLLVASGTPLSEYGAISIPPPFRGFASQRGTAGRTPAIWDLGIRGSYDLPISRRSGVRTRLLLDLQHLGSPRKVVDVDQWHYTCLDANGGQSCPNANYGAVERYQPPMMARLGVLVDLR